MTQRSDFDRKWYVLDVKDQILGRASTRIANLLMGKGKPIYSHSTDCGDFVVAVNASKIKITGNKGEQKISFHHTSHPGGGRSVLFKKLLAEKPERALYLSVKRMLPKNKLASRQILRLKIYRQPTHPHAAQQAEKIEVAN